MSTELRTRRTRGIPLAGVLHLLAASLSGALIFGCGEDEGPTTVHPPVTLSGVFDADWDPRTSIQGEVKVSQDTRPGTYQTDGEAIIDSLGGFEMGVIPGEYIVGVDLPYSRTMFLNQEGRLVTQPSPVRILASDGSVHWESQAHRVGLELQPGYGEEKFWSITVENDADVILHESFRPGVEPVLLRNLPSGSFDCVISTPWREDLTPLLFEDGTPQPDFMVGPRKERQYTGMLPDPFFVRVNFDGLPSDLQSSYVEVLGVRESGNHLGLSVDHEGGGISETFPVFDAEPLRLEAGMWAYGYSQFSTGTEWVSAAPGDTVVAYMSFGELVVKVEQEDIDLDYVWLSLQSDSADPSFLGGLASQDATPGTLRFIAKTGRYLVSLRDCSGVGTIPLQWLGGTKDSRPVEIRSGETTYVTWTPWEGTTISGSLSRPLEEHESLHYSRDCSYSGTYQTELETSDSGSFRIEDVGYETFLLWVHSREDRSTYYYPGTFDPAEAERIQIDSDQGIKDLLFHLP